MTWERIVYTVTFYLMLGHLVVQTFYRSESRLKDVMITLIWPIWAAFRVLLWVVAFVVFIVGVAILYCRGQQHRLYL